MSAKTLDQMRESLRVARRFLSHVPARSNTALAVRAEIRVLKRDIEAAEAQSTTQQKATA
jgi:hypothetical protein